MHELRQYSKECRISAADDASRRPRACTAVATAATSMAAESECGGVIRGLFKLLRPEIAVNGLVLDIPVGSFYGLVGPNGAGKTTTLNMVTGLLVPDAGTAMILGHDVWSDVNTANAHDSASMPQPDQDLRPTDRFAIARLLRHAARHEPR